MNARIVAHLLAAVLVVRGAAIAALPARSATMSQAAARQGERPAGAAAAESVEAGRRAFVSKGCYACHGREGQGSPTTGPRLGPNPPALAAFMRAVRTPRNQMPPFSDALVSDKELNDIYSFVQSRPGPQSIESLVPSK
jgi:mono/diheme cytochrome c family protein